jgi:hypothetical protein
LPQGFLLNRFLSQSFLQHGRLFRSQSSSFEFKRALGLLQSSRQAASGLGLRNVIAAFGRLRLGGGCLRRRRSRHERSAGCGGKRSRRCDSRRWLGHAKRFDYRLGLSQQGQLRHICGWRG